MPGRTLLGFLLTLAGATALAQELEPHSYSGTPIRTNFLVAGYTGSNGGVLLDPSIPVSDVQARIDSVNAVFGGTTAVFGRTGSFAIAVPYAWSDVSGEVGETSRTVTPSGLADLRMRFGLNLLGAKALTPVDFARSRPRPLLGAGLVIVAPTGQYDSSKLINIGSNRWAFKPEIGVSHPHNRWLFEGSVAAWLFADNNNFLGGRREQEPIGSVQAHVSYTFQPGLWVAGSATYYWGGRTTFNEIEKDDVQGNSRFGLTMSVPLAANQSIKVAWSTGVSTRFGGDFDSWGLFWQYAWFRRP